MNEMVKGARRVLLARKIKVLRDCDHSGEAERAGLHMPSTKLITFRPQQQELRSCSPLAVWCYDLTLTTVVTEDNSGRVWLLLWVSNQAVYPSLALLTRPATSDISLQALQRNHLGPEDGS